MITTSQIRDKVNSYLRREISMSEFEDWLSMETWNMHADSTEEAVTLVFAVEICLAENGTENFDEEKVREALRKTIKEGE